MIIFEHYYAATRLSLIGRIIILYLGIEFPFIYPSWKSKFRVIVRSRWIASRGDVTRVGKLSRGGLKHSLAGYLSI